MSLCPLCVPCSVYFPPAFFLVDARASSTLLRENGLLTTTLWWYILSFAYTEPSHPWFCRTGPSYAEKLAWNSHSFYISNVSQHKASALFLVIGYGSHPTHFLFVCLKLKALSILCNDLLDRLLRLVPAFVDRSINEKKKHNKNKQTNKKTMLVPGAHNAYSKISHFAFSLFHKLSLWNHWLYFSRPIWL